MNYHPYPKISKEIEDKIERGRWGERKRWRESFFDWIMSFRERELERERATLEWGMLMSFH